MLSLTGCGHLRLAVAPIRALNRLMSSPSACSREVTVNLENGLHMSPSAKLVQLAQSFNCDIVIRKGERSIDGKSMLDLLTLAAAKGTKLVLEATGDGAAEAIDALHRLFETNFIDENG